jgi:single-strand DNA-binding protein
VVKNPEIVFSKAGKPWVRIRVVSKDRKQDSNGVWGDADEWFLDVVGFGSYAENIAESVLKGDMIIAHGPLKAVERTDDNGVKHTNVQLVADYIGVSVAVGPAKTQRMISDQSGSADPAGDAAPEGAAEPQDAPF